MRYGVVKVTDQGVTAIGKKLEGERISLCWTYDLMAAQDLAYLIGGTVVDSEKLLELENSGTPLRDAAEKAAFVM